MRVPEAGKIAVLRANGVGDFLFALPALEALRAAYPACEIVLLGLPWHRRFLWSRPGPVDRVVVVPLFHGIRDEAGREPDILEIERFFAEMRAERFDAAIQMHGGGQYSNPFVRRLGARVTLGLRTPDAAPLDRWLPYVYFQSEVLRCLEVASLAGAPPVTLAPRVAVTPGDLAESRRFLEPGAEPVVFLNPDAGDGRRRWSLESFEAVARSLGGNGMRVVMHTPRLRQRLSLGGLAGLVSRCALAISNDAGPLHLAAAAGAPCIGLYWCVNVITAAPPWRAAFRPLISWRVDCPVCGRSAIHEDCGHRASMIDGITTGEVLEAAYQLLESSPRERLLSATL